jgi:hypothetical protein
MQQQHQEDETSSFAPLTREAQSTPARYDNNDLYELPEEVSVQIEDYLDHVCAPLVAHVPYKTRREWRGEMRTHLESLTLAHVELGDAPDVAAANALKQFGASDTVSKQWQQEWEQTGQSSAFDSSLQVARRWYGGAFCLTAAILLLTGDLINQGRSGLAVTVLLCLLTPLVVGVGIGRQARHPIKASLAGMAWYVLPVLLLYMVVFTYSKGFHYIHWDEVRSNCYLRTLQEGLKTGRGYGMTVGSFVALLQMLCWTVIGVPAAAVTRWTHHTPPRLRRRIAR